MISGLTLVLNREDKTGDKMCDAICKHSAVVLTKKDVNKRISKKCSPEALQALPVGALVHDPAHVLLHGRVARVPRLPFPGYAVILNTAL